MVASLDGAMPPDFPIVQDVHDGIGIREVPRGSVAEEHGR